MTAGGKWHGGVGYCVCCGPGLQRLWQGRAAGHEIPHTNGGMCEGCLRGCIRETEAERRPPAVV
eukprot:417101-Amphidinium_carterae.2